MVYCKRRGEREKSFAYIVTCVRAANCALRRFPPQKIKITGAITKSVRTAGDGETIHLTPEGEIQWKSPFSEVR